MIESTVGWFGVREKYCLLTDKLNTTKRTLPGTQIPQPSNISNQFKSIRPIQIILSPVQEFGKERNNKRVNA